MKPPGKIAEKKKHKNIIFFIFFEVKKFNENSSD